jgi:ethanolamine utilization protein EutN
LQRAGFVILAKIVGPVVATQKHKSFNGRRILIVEPVDPQGKANGTDFLAFDDDIRAAPGDTVLVCREGNGCRQIWNEKLAPVNSVIVGVVDQIV